ncbi:hypothetical protein [Streptacidiphilus cavernicola]|uniref:ABC transporter permease n=1 Tax=Streptacidiphilus cavernicola TaxID=3342716 RepID=A0ABV6VT18_9ACTN
MTAPDTFQDSPQDSPALAARARRDLRPLGHEAGLALLLIAGSALLGLLMGVCWHWLAPKVPMHADSSAVYLNDPEGEQAIGADGTFALLGAGFGLVSALVAYLLTRRRQGGVGVAVGLAGGGLLGSYLAWGGGQSAKAYQNAVLKLAKSVPTGHTFHGPLQLTTKAVVLIWPMAALLLLLALVGLFTPRPAAPQPVWPEPVDPFAPAPPQDPFQKPSQDPRQAPVQDPRPTPGQEPQEPRTPLQTPRQDGPERP